MNNDHANRPLEIVQQAIVERINADEWTVGDRLPSIREMADALGVNKNTVYSAYKRLEQDGVLVVKRSDGVYVNSKPEAGVGIEAEIRNALVVARLRGTDKTDAKKMLQGILDGVYSERLASLAFIECNQDDVNGICNELMMQLPIEVKPLLVEDVKKNPMLLQPYSIVCTTYYHIHEVKEAKGTFEGNIIALHHAPNNKAVHAVGGLAKGTKICLITSNEQTRQLIRGFLYMFEQTDLIECFSHEEEQMQEKISQSEVIITHHNALEAVEKANRNKRVINVQFHIEPQSIEYLREELMSSY